MTDPSDVLAFGEGFHTDLTYLQNPPRAAILVSRKLSPPGTGDTLFVDAFALAATLPPELRARAAGRHALHTDKAGRNATHPVLRVVSGRPALWVNRHFARRLASDGDESPADAALLEELLAHIDVATACGHH